jgi:hypothetical protein
MAFIIGPHFVIGPRPQLRLAAGPWPCWPDRPSLTRALRYIGVRRLWFNHKPSSAPFSFLCVASHLDCSTACHLLDCMPPPPRSTLSAQRVGATPLPSTPPPAPPLPPWLSRLVRKIPSSRSMAQVTRFRKVGEVAEDSTPNGAPKW